MKYKKVYAWKLIAALTIALAAGCGNSENQAAFENTEKTANTQKQENTEFSEESNIQEQAESAVAEDTESVIQLIGRIWPILLLCIRQ